MVGGWGVPNYLFNRARPVRGVSEVGKGGYSPPNWGPEIPAYRARFSDFSRGTGNFRVEFLIFKILTSL